VDDNAAWLEPTEATPLDGSERFSQTDASVGDFWSYAFSDLRTNIVRGVLAEFLVARAVNAEQPVRLAWDNYDVLAPDGTRIEVKSSAYLQSWAQRKLSNIRFTGLTGLAWDDKEGWGTERQVRADVFVFAVHTCRVPSEYAPLDVDQWEFYVAKAEAVRDYGARSVGMGFLQAHARGPVGWAELRSAVAAARGPDADHS
jgi:hypothetical protein